MKIPRSWWLLGSHGKTPLTATAADCQPSTGLPPPFVPIARLGSGGEGEVWLASDPLLDRKVVCKRLHERFDQHAVDNQGEALRTLARVSARGVPSLYGVTDHGAERWLVLEYVEGLSLDHVVSQVNSGLGPVHILVIAIDLCEALHRFHLAGFVHGDVSPANAVITRDGRARFVDFGLTREIGDDLSSRGVDGFCAPETVHDCVASPVVDGYAVGALLFWILCRRTPTQLYDAAGSAVVLHPETPEMPTAVEGVLWAVARRLTDADPLKRPGLPEVLASLRDHERGLPVGSRDNLARLIRAQSTGRTVDVIGLSDKNHSSPSPRFGRWPLIGVATALLLVLVIGVAQWREEQRAETKSHFSVAVQSMSVSPGTPLPVSLGENWLETHMALELNRLTRESHAGEQRVVLGLSCAQELCQLVAEHHRSEGSHWHQSTVIASRSPGLWRGVIRDLAQAVAGF